MANKVALVKGVEGYAIYLNDHRIAGNKPWGGGTLIKEWKVDPKEIIEQLHNEGGE